jgi:hypothetical protein
MAILGGPGTGSTAAQGKEVPVQSLTEYPSLRDHFPDCACYVQPTNRRADRWPRR